MMTPLIRSTSPITLVGGGPTLSKDFKITQKFAPIYIGVDSGADQILAANLPIFAAIGDLDSISEAAKAAISTQILHHIREQATTDFDKALREVAAPFVLAVGFSGGRLDHALAVLNSLVRHSDRLCIVIGPEDITFAAPAGIELDLTLEPGDLVSLFPMAEVKGQSTGLKWPIEGYEFRPDGFIGTSNQCDGTEVKLKFDRTGMLVILPRQRLAAVLRAFGHPT